MQAIIVAGTFLFNLVDTFTLGVKTNAFFLKESS